MKRIEKEPYTRETEVKIQLNIPVEEVVELLRKQGIDFSEPVIQNDVIFVKDAGSFPDVPLGQPVLRIREQSETFVLTLKEGVDNELDNLEFELLISDKEMMTAILSRLGLSEVVRVNKVRRKAQYQNFTFCLDIVEDLGLFLEVESLSNIGGNAVQSDISMLLSRIGLSGYTKVVRGYDSLLFNKQNND